MTRPIASMAASFAAYVVVFALLALPSLGSAAHAVPHWWSEAWPEDARLLIWVLAWMAHALATDPAHLLDANVNYPAPRQLTGSEHVLTSQLVFGPLYALTGNPVLAANLTAFLSYPLAALAMERLLLALGCARSVALVSGLGFALGPLRVPANLQLLQYQNLYLPLAALGLTALRERASPRAAVALGAVLVAGLLSAFYLAAILCVTVVLWILLEWARPEAAAGAIGIYGIPTWFLGRMLRITLPSWFGIVPVGLAALGVGTLALRRPPVARRLAAAGVVLSLAGFALAFPPRTLALLISASPLRFFRYHTRFLVVAGFGASLLAAAALEAARARLPRLGTAIVAAAGLAILLTRGLRLVELGTEEIPAWGRAGPVYDAVGRVARAQGSGPLLELPLDAPGGRNRESDALVGSIRHWLPLVAGRTGYPPAHRALVNETVRRLGDPQALDDLVDMTHVRWILLRPDAEWDRPATRAALLGLSGTRAMLDIDGWVLERVERTPQHPGWFAAIARGLRPGETPLGMPLRRIAEDEAVAEVRAHGLPDLLGAGRGLPLELDVVNAGRAGWPVAVPPGGDARFTVHLVARWDALDAGLDEIPPRPLALPRDLPPGEAITVRAVLPTPRRPGRYLLEVRVEQIGGATFGGPANLPLRRSVTLVPDREAQSP